MCKNYQQARNKEIEKASKNLKANKPDIELPHQYKSRQSPNLYSKATNLNAWQSNDNSAPCFTKRTLATHTYECDEAA